MMVRDGHQPIRRISLFWSYKAVWATFTCEGMCVVEVEVLRNIFFRWLFGYFPPKENKHVLNKSYAFHSMMMDEFFAYSIIPPHPVHVVITRNSYFDGGVGSLKCQKNASNRRIAINSLSGMGKKSQSFTRSKLTFVTPPKIDGCLVWFGSMFLQTSILGRIFQVNQPLVHFPYIPMFKTIYFWLVVRTWDLGPCMGFATQGMHWNHHLLQMMWHQGKQKNNLSNV